MECLVVPQQIGRRCRHGRRRRAVTANRQTLQGNQAPALLEARGLKELQRRFVVLGHVHRNVFGALDGDFAHQGLHELRSDAAALKCRLAAQCLDPRLALAPCADDRRHRLMPLERHHAVAGAYGEQRHVGLQQLFRHFRRAGVVDSAALIDRPHDQFQIVRAAKTVRGHEGMFLTEARGRRKSRIIPRRPRARPVAIPESWRPR